MSENFDLIFGQNASQQYAWSDSDYQNGWETIGNIPPTAAQFDALQRRSDTKMKELNDELTPLVNADTADSRQPSTTYSEGDIKYSPLLPTGWFLTCTTAGITSASEIVLPTPIAEGDTVTDGEVVWEIHKIGSAANGGDGFAVGDIIMIAGNNTIRDGWLECDGRAVSRTMFPDLFAAIGTTYGAGDGSTTFNLPNYSDGKFPEGSTVAGVVKQPGLPNIEGTLHSVWQAVGDNVKTGAFVDSTVSSLDENAPTSTRVNYYNNIVFDASRSNPIYGNSTTVQPYSLTCRYVIKAYDGVTPTPSQADISEILTELTGKADRDLDNLSATGEARFAHVVVGSYYDDTTGDWWREYADGWVEQGGIATGGYYNAPATISLVKPMADINYTIVGNCYAASAYSVFWSVYFGNITTTSFNAVTSENGASPKQYPFKWYACGMGAQS